MRSVEEFLFKLQQHFARLLKFKQEFLNTSHDWLLMFKQEFLNTSHDSWSLNRNSSTLRTIASYNTNILVLLQWFCYCYCPVSCRMIDRTYIFKCLSMLNDNTVISILMQHKNISIQLKKGSKNCKTKMQRSIVDDFHECHRKLWRH
jgi:hypothetical protein